MPIEPTRLTKIAQPATAKLGMSTIADQGLDYSKMPYNRLQPMGMIPDLVVPGVLHAVRDPLGSDPRLWVPLSNTVSFHPIHFNVSPGFYAHVMRVTQGGVLSRYRDTGGVHALVLKGRWHYLATGLPKKVHTRLSRPARRTP